MTGWLVKGAHRACRNNEPPSALASPLAPALPIRVLGVCYTLGNRDGAAVIKTSRVRVRASILLALSSRKHYTTRYLVVNQGHWNSYLRRTICNNYGNASKDRCYQGRIFFKMVDTVAGRSPYVELKFVLYLPTAKARQPAFC